jgi:hypothetical protein
LADGALGGGAGGGRAQVDVWRLLQQEQHYALVTGTLTRDFQPLFFPSNNSP